MGMHCILLQAPAAAAENVGPPTTYVVPILQRSSYSPLDFILANKLFILWLLISEPMIVDADCSDDLGPFR